VTLNDLERLNGRGIITPSVLHLKANYPVRQTGCTAAIASIGLPIISETEMLSKESSFQQ